MILKDLPAEERLRDLEGLFCSFPQAIGVVDVVDVETGIHHHIVCAIE